MTSSHTYHNLSDAELAQIRARAMERRLGPNEVVFAEGDETDCLYFIESGKVSVSIQKFTLNDEIAALGPGEYFGEMGVLNNGRRAATVTSVSDTCLLSLDKQACMDLLAADRELARKVERIFDRRNADLLRKESVGEGASISIKGDPSLRESAFDRQRYESVADKVLPQLVPRLREMLLERSVYDIVIHFNSGEVHLGSVFAPFHTEIHPANKLVDESYVARHFPPLAYETKVGMIRHLNGVIAAGERFAELPEHIGNAYRAYHAEWQPLPAEDIDRTVMRLTDLRKIPNFYLRNFAINMTRNVIRMQFNCDGTHIISVPEFEQFLEDNIPLE